MSVVANVMRSLAGVRAHPCRGGVQVVCVRCVACGEVGWRGSNGKCLGLAARTRGLPMKQLVNILIE